MRLAFALISAALVLVSPFRALAQGDQQTGVVYNQQGSCDSDIAPDNEFTCAEQKS